MTINKLPPLDITEVIRKEAGITLEDARHMPAEGPRQKAKSTSGTDDPRRKKKKRKKKKK